MEKKRLYCPRCQNKDPTYFYFGGKGWYCRKCIDFNRFLLSDKSEIDNDIKYIETQYVLPFNLSEKQVKVAKKIKDNYQKHNILVYATCGAGKTELLLDFLSDALSKGYKVGWAIPRRAVVLQLQQRLQDYFKDLIVIAVCQGYTTTIQGDLIICTTHQLFRYYKYFDYLVIDEPDSFPFKDNTVLKNIAISSVKGKIIFLTATPDDFAYKHTSYQVELFERPHKHPLDIPKVIRVISSLDHLVLSYYILKNKKKLLVFVPSIKMANSFGLLYRILCDCSVLTSKSDNKEKIVEDFIKKDNAVLISTTILERGLTIPNVNVIVFQADSDIYDLAALVQMAGRVGRVKEYPSGKILFITNNSSIKVKKCIKSIENMNLAA